MGFEGRKVRKTNHGNRIYFLFHRHPIYGAEFVTELKRKNGDIYQIDDVKNEHKNKTEPEEPVKKKKKKKKIDDGEN